MKRLLTALPLLLLTACGSGRGAHVAAPSPSPVALTEESAKAAAADVTLRLEDMPSPTGYAAHPAAPEQHTLDDRILARCLGDVGHLREPLAVSTSPDFVWGEGLLQRRVSSDVAVLSSDAEARRDLAVLTGPKAVPCLSAFLSRSLSRGGSTFASPQAAKVETPAPGAIGSYGYELRFTGQRLGVTVPLVVRIQGFLVLHTEVTLVTFNAGQPFPEADRAQLLDTLLVRASRSAV
ncbi:MAG: hypothetical protein QOI82_1590 [Actinomycetota bacterium]|jgi:hypothetical protein|nr:hypothetical protein [Actinomycetota bacterium]